MDLDRIKVDELKYILENQNVRTLFQPIINLHNGNLLGYEALSRGPKGSLLEGAFNLFSAAKKFDKLMEIEELCRNKALDRFGKFKLDCKLFINIDPMVIYQFNQRSKEKLLLSKGNIVIELTEKTSIDNFERFSLELEDLKKKGYKVAIDDAGSGYSGLQSIVSISYNYIKLDMSLVRDIDKNMIKYYLLKSLVKFARDIGAKVIAEGIETKEELRVLMDLGVDYGQGYLISRPSNLPKSELAIRDYIIKERMLTKVKDDNIIGSIATKGATLSIDDKIREAVALFEKDSTLQNIVILKETKPCGLLTRNRLYSKLGTRYGYSNYIDKKVGLIMNKEPLVVDKNRSIESVARLIMDRDLEEVYDSVIVSDGSKYYGDLAVKNILDKLSKLQIERAKRRSPLTGLPGNLSIEEEISNRILFNQPLSVLYIDIDNFKPYNDSYGYKKGDDVITFTADILKKTLMDFGDKSDFVGHIGGDDFVIVTTPEKDEVISQELIKRFNNGIGRFFNEEDINKGYILSTSRSGKEYKAPLITISIAIVNNQNYQIVNHRQVSDIVVELKQKAKGMPGSNFIKGREII
ncbi:GGDEF domain-containing protein [Halonatronum saccharophilum]|uniref:GGDEF domain-containing protein n=1 Tax=Halonatronum saccharophilum TaxID=150060 RepID=UPI000484E3B2|nr:GGDEF domain-containing protein [Halonatronum saccharophilum]